MTVEMLVAVIVLLVVKYTLEFADRTRRGKGRRSPARKRVMSPRDAPALVLDLAARERQTRTGPATAADPPSEDCAPEAGLIANYTQHTPKAYWDALADELEKSARRGEDWRPLLDERIAGMQRLRARWQEGGSGGTGSAG